MTTAGAQIHRQLRKWRLQRVRANWARFALVMIVGLALAAVFAWFGAAFWPDVVTGAFVGLVVAGTAFVVYAGVCSGTEHLAMGGEAESWTAGLFARTFRSACVINDVRFEGGNVDHVVVGSHGVAVVETKWRGHSLYGQPRSLSDEDVGQALWAARKIRLFLHGMAVNPLPVLILWGPGISPGEPLIRDGVLVLRGSVKPAALRVALGEQIGLGKANRAVADPIATFVKRARQA